MSPKGKVYVFEEVLKHNRLKDCWLIIAGKVYDVTEFMMEHPGGDDILISSTGKDVTKDFEDTGHSDEAREKMETFCIGEIDETTLTEQKRYFIPQRQQTSSQDNASQPMIKILQYLVPLFVLGIAFAIRNYTKDK